MARAEEAGLVERAREHASSRAVTVTLTRAGHEMVEALVDRVLGREAELIDCLSTEQQETLTELLRVLLTDLETTLGRPQHTQVGSP